MRAMLKVINFLATGVREAAHSAAENGIGVELRERFGEFMRRVRRGGLIFVGIIGGLIAYSLIFGSIGLLLWIIALPFAAIAAAVSMLWPTHRAQVSRRGASRSTDISTLARSTRLWLERRVGRLPLQARNAARATLSHLNDIANTPAGPDADLLLRGEVERLIGRHLPRLVESYCRLPTVERGRDSEADQHLTEGLTAIAVELGNVSQQVSKTASHRFEVERRFIALRFPNDSGLTGALQAVERS